MIEILRDIFSRKPRLIAVFAFRHDAHLVPDLLSNISGFIDGHISHDDRNHNELWCHEGKARNNLIEKARDAGANWVICPDPDERFEINAGAQIRKLIMVKEKIIYGFKLREMWTRDSYRIDGIWNTKTKFILFPLLPGQKFYCLHIHSPWHPTNKDYKKQLLDINVYHLKMIDPEQRQERRRIFNLLDPDRQIQKIGYDYLTDETDLELEKIAPERGFHPEIK
jgi:hypothetical protein